MKFLYGNNDNLSLKANAIFSRDLARDYTVTLLARTSSAGF